MTVAHLDRGGKNSMGDLAPALHTVVVQPGGFTVMAKHGEPLLVAANREGYFWPTACGGEAICTRCFMEVPEEQEAAFSPMLEREREGLEKVRWAAGPRPGERLACQAQVLADAEVRKRFVRVARETDVLPFANGLVDASASDEG
jgi:ferredoxin, 2Fe-2S